MHRRIGRQTPGRMDICRDDFKQPDRRTAGVQTDGRTDGQKANSMQPPKPRTQKKKRLQAHRSTRNHTTSHKSGKQKKKKKKEPKLTPSPILPLRNQHSPILTPSARSPPLALNTTRSPTPCPPGPLHHLPRLPQLRRRRPRRRNLHRRRLVSPERRFARYDAGARRR